MCRRQFLGPTPRRPSRPCSQVFGQGDYVVIQAFVDPDREHELEPLVDQARATGCIVTVGLGPRYLHSTGQLHKGGPPTGHFIQVVDDTGRGRGDPEAEVQASVDSSRLRLRGDVRGTEGARASRRSRQTGGSRMNLGMVGLGKMGGNMTERLRRAGHTGRDLRAHGSGADDGLARRARRQARPPARGLAHDPGRRPDGERVPDARPAARGRRHHRRRRQLELPRLAAARRGGGREEHPLPRRGRLGRRLGPRGGLLHHGRRRRRRLRAHRAVRPRPRPGRRLRARRRGRRRSLREDGPQRDRVRDDAVARRGLRDHARVRVRARPAGSWPTSGSTARSSAAGCSSCSSGRSPRIPISPASAATSRTRARAAGRWRRRSTSVCPAPAIALALFSRFASRQDESFAAKVNAALRNQFGGHAVQSADKPE